MIIYTFRNIHGGNHLWKDASKYKHINIWSYMWIEYTVCASFKQLLSNNMLANILQSSCISLHSKTPYTELYSQDIPSFKKCARLGPC